MLKSNLARFHLEHLGNVGGNLWSMFLEGSFAELKGTAIKGAHGTFEQQFGVEKSPGGLLQFKASSFLPSCFFVPYLG